MRCACLRIGLVVLMMASVIAPLERAFARDDEEEVAFSDESGDELDDELAFLEEGDQVESAARHRQEIGMSPSAITVITREDIETSGATSLTDLFRMVPGLGVMVPTISYPSLVGRSHWVTANLTFLMLIDGRQVNIELLGSPPWKAQPISLDDIQRIEIIRGPGSSLYGANAVDGVISITTRAIGKGTSGYVGLAGGEPGYYEADARASVRIGDWGLSVGGGFERSGMFTNPRERDERVWKFRAAGEYQFSEDKKLSVDFGLSGARGFVHTKMGKLDVDMTLRNLRVAYESEDVRAHVYWSQMPADIDLRWPFEYRGITMARAVPTTIDSHAFDGEVQWTLPTFWNPLMIIVGGRGRADWLGSDDLLDADTFGNPDSDRYHQPGISRWEGRGGVFVHGEFAPVDWVTLTAGLRFDYNSVTGDFTSPRVAAVFRPARQQFIRVGVARAFRKPAFIETAVHPNVVFPEDSPITGTDQERFREFMTRVNGNTDLDNEEVLAFEIGYLGRFLDDRLSVNLDLYYSMLSNTISEESNIVHDELTGLPDLETSSFQSVNTDTRTDITGLELSLQWDLSRNIALMAFWNHRQMIDQSTGRFRDDHPKNLLGLGGRMRTGFGLLGSLYVFSRSHFVDRIVENPKGLLEPPLTQEMPSVFVVTGRIGWRGAVGGGVELETGIRLFLPVSPFEAPHFRFRSEGGGISDDGYFFGGIELARLVSVYLQGTFSGPTLD